MNYRLRHILALAFILIATIPVLLLGVWVEKTAMKRELSTVSEVHLLLAQNLTHALDRYAEDTKAVFDFLTATSEGRQPSAEGIDLARKIGFRHLGLADDGGRFFMSWRISDDAHERIPKEIMDRLLATTSGETTFSGVMHDSEGRPTLFLTRRLPSGRIAVAALSLDFIRKVQKSIRFGRKGHSAIVDRQGNVLAHPRLEWQREIRNLAAVEPISLTMQGKTGVTTFFSPAVNMDMITGYTFVPSTGWGVIVPQPLEELEERAAQFRQMVLGVTVIGLVAAALISWFLSGLLVRPVKAAARAAQDIVKGDLETRMSTYSSGAPVEFGELGAAFDTMAQHIDQALSERQEAEQTAQLARSRLEDAINSINHGILLCDAEDRIVLFNETYRTMNPDWSDASIVGRPFADLLRDRTAGDAVPADDENRAAFIEERMAQHERADGSTRVWRTNDGRFLQASDARTRDGGTVVLVTDVTETVQREEQLRQAQKMEAIGQLTGGVAHDFNNLLAIIQGNISFLDRSLDAESELKKLTAPALRAAKRGASLTQRLLAFSRRQPLRAEVIDVGELVVGLDEMLRRSLGEDIVVETSIAPDLWKCAADSGQLEQAIINLANNGRDAMPMGGLLSIDVSNTTLSEAEVAQEADVEPGEYVVVAVTDTGSGMLPETKKRIFDPFFTTKEVGKGTGLGLSMVYGFAKQSGGHVAACSEVDRGTTIKIYLPRSRAAEAARESRAADLAEIARGETVLVVEDDADLRALAVVVLSDLGYRVLEAGSGKVALRLLAGENDIDLLLTDVVLPDGMGGKAVADAVRAKLPFVKVLFMTGYAEDAMVHDGRVDPGVSLLRKPFDPEELARVVRAAIDS